MNDTDTKTAAAAQAILDARDMVRQLDQHVKELTAALMEFRSNRQRDIDLRQREAAVLAREDRCTIRERELEKREV